MRKEPPFEERLFEVNGNLWNYERIATVSARIAEEFLERLDISVLERHALLHNFVKDILDITGGVDRTVELIGRESLFYAQFSEGTEPYQFNDNGDIVDYLGAVVPPNFELNNQVSLDFMQRAHRDKFIKDTPIPKMQAEEVMEFVREVCKKHQGISPLFGPTDIPEVLQQSLQYAIISSLQFDENLYGNGIGLVKVRLLKYEAV